jgi:glycosyltransferase involved in cell wall biosynthesis
MNGSGTPLVSIITPSWNVEHLIGETIASVQA